MRAILAAAALCACALTSATAHAAPWGYQYDGVRAARVRHLTVRFPHRLHVRHSPRWHGHRVAEYGADSRPAAWCGWYLRRILHVADRTFNRALAWLRWGRPSGPRVGAVAVWSHGGGRGHVALIRGAPDARGRWLIEDGNDGPARVHRRSLAGAIAFRTP